MLNEKTIILDASSAILLFKACLHKEVIESYHVLMPESVYLELTRFTRSGSLDYHRLCKQKKIQLEPVSFEHSSVDQHLSKLDQGEQDCFKLFLSGKGDFIVTDDGAAAKYCMQYSIPFINALLVPRVLEYSGVIDENSRLKAYQEISEKGRYSNEILCFAEGAVESDLKNFLAV